MDCESVVTYYFPGMKVMSLKLQTSPARAKHLKTSLAWHGEAFVGNHIHRALEPKIWGRHRESSLEDCPTALPIAPFCSKGCFNLLWETRLVSTPASGRCSLRPTSEEVIATLDVRIKSFLSAARRGIVDRKLGNITPKLHLLERHVVAQMSPFGTGLGLTGEHGAESIHAELNLLAATFDAVPRELDLLAVIAKQHCIYTLLRHLAQVLQPKTRKKTPKDWDNWRWEWQTNQLTNC